MAVRSLQKGEAAASGLRAEFPDARIEVWQLDMESYRSVQAFTARCERELDRLHVAVLNAGFGTNKFERAEEGGRHESTIQVNYLSTALLSILLIPRLKPSGSASSSGPGRLTIIGSDSALPVRIEDPGDGGLLDSFDSPDRVQGFQGFEQYATSKLLITMFAARLAETVSPDEVIINCCNPGATKGTAFLDDVNSWLIKLLFSFLFNTIGRTAEDASRIYVHSCLLLGKESHGSFTDWHIRP
jgi:NAD(P)-dependent dehydrogenase (short-subunit alcohol dehydrogenase family)